MTIVRGLTWDHPRAHTALDELTRLDRTGSNQFWQVPGPLEWDRQPLSGFESAPIADLAARYDVLVLDHPGLPDAVAAEALVPLDQVFSTAWLAELRSATVGPSYDSYHYAGSQWALPLDAATQVGVARTDLLDRTDAPTTWPEAVRLAASTATALCLGGPHAVLMLLALCVAQGDAPCRGADFTATEACHTALETMAELLAHADRGVSQLDPIGVLDAMARGAVAYCPLVYGYVTYSRQDTGRLAFHDAPTWDPGGRSGSVLGGTGLAISARRGDPAMVRPHLARLVDPTTQLTHIPCHGGQPAARAAWLDPAVNEQAHGFYLATIRTVEHAWVRPRRLGFVAFCDRASALVRDGLFDGTPVRQIARQVETAYRNYCTNEGKR